MKKKRLGGWGKMFLGVRTRILAWYIVLMTLRDKRLPKQQEEMVLRAGDLVLDLRTRQVWVGTQPVKLSAREFTLAETFLSHPRQVMSREILLSQVWGYDYDPGSNVVDVCVGSLRQKLGRDYIETVRGIGYRLRI